MFKKILLITVSLLWLSACGSVPTQTIQTDHADFVIPTYRQKSADTERLDTRTDQTWSLFVEYTSIPVWSSFTDFIQANINTLRQNMSTQIKDDVIQSNTSIGCSGTIMTWSTISFAIQHAEDVLYLSQIFTIQGTDINVISIASLTDEVRDETTNTIIDNLQCKK